MPSSSHSRSGWTGYDDTHQLPAPQARRSQDEVSKYSSKSSSTLSQTVSTSNLHWQQLSKQPSTSGNQSMRSLPSSCYIPVPRNIQPRHGPSSSISSLRNPISTGSSSETHVPHQSSSSLSTIPFSTPRPSIPKASVLSQHSSTFGRTPPRQPNFKRGSSYSRIGSRLPAHRKPSSVTRYKFKKN